MRSAIFVFAGFVATSLPVPVFAAKILDCKLVVDGSSKPPGDRVEYSVLLTGQEQKPVVEIRPFTLVGDPVIVAPVNASAMASQDSKGGCLFSKSLEEGATLRVIPGAVVVPYESLDLKI